jgi:crossover junction endodeoxyribonuclease RuvC
MQHIAHGVIHLDGRETIAKRLTFIERGLEQVLAQYTPEVGSVESLFFHKDAQAAAKLGHARGVVLLSLARAGLEIAEYPPARVKRTIAGTGRAEKYQVAMMVRAMLRLNELPQSDAADALALAITHLRIGGLLNILEEQASPEFNARTANGQKISERGILALLGKRPRRRARAG